MSHSFRRGHVATRDVKRVVCPSGKIGFTRELAS